MDERGRLGVKRCAEKNTAYQTGLFTKTEPEWVEVDVKRVRVERSRKFGGPWLGRELLRRLELDHFMEEQLPNGREEVPWSAMAMILILGRLCEPSSELHLAEHLYEASAMSDLLGVLEEKVNEDRLYRALDTLLPHKKALEKLLKEKLGELFDLDYDLLLYDITSTYFEGQAEGKPQAQRGYSRDHRPDCKQVNIALVVSRCGMPLGYEVFAGNRHDATTLEEIVAHMEELYGRAGRVWIMDRGLASEKNVRFLRAGGRRYILGRAKNSLRKFARELLSADWKQVHEGLEVRLVPAPDGEEVFILCRSAERQAKEQAMHERFEKRIEEGLLKIAASGSKRRQQTGVVERRVGRRASRNCAGRRWRVGGSGRVGVKAATCCAAT
jgi:transposase